MTRILCSSAAALASLVAFSAFAQPVITVQDYGAAPREEIRYRFTQDATAQATMTMNMQMSMSMGGVAMPATPVPAIEIPLTLRTSEVRPDGSARHDFEFGAPKLAEGSAGNPMGQAMEAGLAGIAGSKGWYRIDTRGNLQESSLNLPTGTSSQASQVINEIQNQVQQLSAPFPQEAVGVGARWQLTTSIVVSGMPLQMTTAYALQRHDGDTVVLGVSTTQGTQDSGTGTGSGTMTIDLAGMVPISEINANSSTTMSMPMRGQTQNMSMAMQMTMTIKPD